MAYLLRPQEVDVDIGISGGRINAVMAEVFTHVLRGGLRKQPINAFPWENNIKKKSLGFCFGSFVWFRLCGGLGFLVCFGWFEVLFCFVFFKRDASLLLWLSKLWRDKHSNEKSNHFRHRIAKSQHKHIKICTLIQLQKSKGGKRTIH